MQMDLSYSLYYISLIFAWNSCKWIELKIEGTLLILIIFAWSVRAGKNNFVDFMCQFVTSIVYSCARVYVISVWINTCQWPKINLHWWLVWRHLNTYKISKRNYANSFIFGGLSLFIFLLFPRKKQKQMKSLLKLINVMCACVFRESFNSSWICRIWVREESIEISPESLLIVKDCFRITVSQRFFSKNCLALVFLRKKNWIRLWQNFIVHQFWMANDFVCSCFYQPRIL